MQKYVTLTWQPNQTLEAELQITNIFVDWQPTNHAIVVDINEFAIEQITRSPPSSTELPRKIPRPALMERPF